MFLCFNVFMQLVKPDKPGIRAAVKVLRRGGVVAFPTDTAYGLGGVFDSLAVIRRVLRIKNRRDRKFTVVAADLAQVQKFFKLKPAELKLARQYWPGPLSLVVSPRLSVRVPGNKLTRDLAKLAGKPLIATSANRHGRPEIYSAAGVRREFAGQPDQPELILDGGRLKQVKPSTVVKVVRGRIVVLRAGTIKIDLRFSNKCPISKLQ
jgi:L-threonylcarbamoyladenylate synthase